MHTRSFNIQLPKKLPGYLFLVMMSASLPGCKKFIAVDTPSTSISAENVYETDATAAAVLTGMYTTLSRDNTYPSALIGSATMTASTLSPFLGLSADELTLYPAATDIGPRSYYRNELQLLVNTDLHFWNSCYNYIYQANAAINGLNKATVLTPAVQQQLLGEAYFLRGYFYFYLVNLYGAVPYTTSTDYTQSGPLPRTSVDSVYNYIISDLKTAQSKLSTSYLKADALSSYATGTEQRVRPTKAAATALLARVYLYTRQYANAETEATTVISSKPVYDTVSLNNVFKLNSQETIWALPSVSSGTAQNTGEGRLYILTSALGPYEYINPVYLSDNLMNAFEATDKRKTNWTSSISFAGITYNFAYKYKIGSVTTAAAEYLVMLRLGEVYLIRAEARAQQGKLTAADDLNIIRKRAGLPNTTANTSADLLDAIARERQVELFTEWGHRWLDLKRTGKADAVMAGVTAQKGGVWDSRWALYPIPQTELNRDRNLVQNPGYR